MFTRRAFLTLAAFLPVSLRVLASNRPKKRGETFLLERCFVAGLRFHDYPTMERSLRAGDLLSLVREPENAHDPRAVAVRAPGGAMLGYVPRPSNGIVATLLELGVDLTAVVIAISPPEPPWRRVELVVTIEAD